MRKLLLITALIAGCAEAPEPKKITPDMPEWNILGGDGVNEGVPRVYFEISQITNCEELQKGFDKNYADHSWRSKRDDYADLNIRKALTSYMGAYLDRMGEIGCQEIK